MSEEERPPAGKVGFRIKDGVLTVTADLKTLNEPFFVGSFMMLGERIRGWFEVEAVKRQQAKPKIFVPGSGQGIIH